MKKLTDFLFQSLPKQVEAVKLLQHIPDAIDTAKELMAYVKRVIEILKQDAPLTPEQDAELDRMIEELKDQSHWQPQGQ